MEMFLLSTIFLPYSRFKYCPYTVQKTFYLCGALGLGYQTNSMLERQIKYILLLLKMRQLRINQNSQKMDYTN